MGQKKSDSFLVLVKKSSFYYPKMITKTARLSK
uniref:Uncharacterized protein n=1 Tax=Arundo donax TaxID=35708 RepID=A0A0A8Y857_ARUDO